ncbi:hypothetical protein PIROE2DRAFT_14519 [Piromyces sp. E2]|nr:hypothetical protein PIROE2DRAFT_14519 [Piromyces sp. E2]|eukprot:OUM59853.1 hypothetical protein PIROE2DRAFT_14519 [Piromyces sp. E2]
MKISNLYFSVIATLCTGFTNAQQNDYSNEINPIDEYIKTLEPVLGIDSMIDPFNMVANAQVKVNINQTIAQYEDDYNKSKDECLRGCYSYSIHLLEISYNLNCDSKFSKINSEYKNNKPCYKVSPEMQNILDNGNAYLDLFCSKNENEQYCPFITNIVKIPENNTILEQVCKTPEDKRKKCDKSLIQNLSIMVDSHNKLGKTDKTTYTSGGKVITINTPNYNIVKVETQLKNNKCLAKVEAPSKILVNIDDNGKNDNKNDTESNAFTTVGQGMTTLMILVTITLIAILF